MTSTVESQRSAIRYAESLRDKVETLIRAQTSTEKMKGAIKPMGRYMTKGETLAIMDMAKRKRAIVDIKNATGRSLSAIRRVLAMNGFDYRCLSKPFSNQEPGSIEIGNKIKEMMLNGQGIYACARILGIKHRVAEESLMLAGGVKLKLKKNRK